MLTAIIAMAATVSTPQSETVDLYRQFSKGETLNYSVQAHMLTETAEQGVSAIPSEIDFLYDFSMHFKDVDEGGFATCIYKRPTITQIDGETADHPPIRTTVDLGMHWELKLSPINEVTDTKDLNPQEDDGLTANAQFVKTLMAAGVAPTAAVQLGGFQQELYRLALFIGSLDSALDFSPKLPVDEVAIGETWKKTVSYQPQALKGGEKGEQAIQRLDMEYKYDGMMEVDGKQIHRISAVVKLDTDAAKFINQAMGTSPSQSGLQSFPLQIETNITFDLDPKTKRTLKANARTKGGWELKAVGVSQAIVKESITGRASMVLKK